MTKRIFALVSALLVTLCMSSMVFATSLDDLQGGTVSTQEQSSTTSSTEGYAGTTDGAIINPNQNAIGEYLKGYTPVTQDNMQKASKIANPLVNLLGTIAGFIIMIGDAAIFVITALDLIYIGVPFIRPTLCPVAQQGGGGSMGMGGYGMGMRGYGMGGYGMGGGQQGAQPQARKWVSDEAIKAVSMFSGEAQQQGGGSMGMGMGMGGYGMQGAQQGAQQPKGSPISYYVKHRMLFIVLFIFASIVLMSSVLTDCGLNIAQLFTKIMYKVNTSIGNVNINY